MQYEHTMPLQCYLEYFQELQKMLDVKRENIDRCQFPAFAQLVVHFSSILAYKHDKELTSPEGFSQLLVEDNGILSTCDDLKDNEAEAVKTKTFCF